MTQHTLRGRHEDELLWFQRRSFLQGAAAWVALGASATALAQQRSNIVELNGDALLNGERLLPQATIQTGDTVETGPRSSVLFVIGSSAYLARQNSRLIVERGTSLNAVSVLRLLTGAVASVWGKGNYRQIVTPTLTAGIRGTGVYTEVFAQEGFRTYFCNCYGTVDLRSGVDRLQSHSDYHESFWGEPQAREGRFLRPADPINHTDEEVEVLARLVNQPTAWQLTGRKGTKAQGGYSHPQPGAQPR